MVREGISNLVMFERHLSEIREKAVQIVGRRRTPTEGVLIGKQFSMVFLHVLGQLSLKLLSKLFVKQIALEARDSTSL